VAALRRRGEDSIPQMSRVGRDPAAATPWRIEMKNFALSLKRFLVSEDGPTAVEYAVMLALIVVVCLSTIALIGTRANETFNQIANSLPASGS
jgi:pilus assembly protein Flp/PilA